MSPPTNPDKTASKIASLILINAMIFQEELASDFASVPTLSSIQRSSDPHSTLTDAWDEVLRIDYYPIFHVARELLEVLPANAELDSALRVLMQKARQIVSKRAALRHDLMGRVYHRLLIEAKFLGTYYTSIPSATLLLKLALDPAKWPKVDWSKTSGVSNFRIADLACGTGTLLMAAVQATVDNYVKGNTASATPLDLSGLHKVLIEDTIFGYDVLASAIHLTASTLATLAPAVVFSKMNLYVVPMGGPHKLLGSLEFLLGHSMSIQRDLFSAVLEAEQLGGTGAAAVTAEVPQMDLCVMNPPFTRSVGGNLLFGSLPDAERAPIQARLAKVIRQGSIQASSTAGLGAPFIAAGDKHLKENGRLALVLPKHLLTGVAWKPTRELLASGYHLESVIVSHEPERWNFSENTDLSEVLLIARKLKRRESRRGKQTLWVNLWRVPRTAIEALALAEAIRATTPAAIEGTGVTTLRTDGRVWGEAFTSDWQQIKGDSWYLHAYAQTDLMRVAHGIIQGTGLKLPASGASAPFPLPLCPLADLGQLGPDVRDIHDAFERVNSVTVYPSLWGHSSDRVRSMKQSPNQYLQERATPLAGRPRRPAALLWPRAGRLFIAERLRLNTHRLAAVFLPDDALGTSWWPVAGEEEEEMILTLWMNSTLGLLSLLALREETEGAWVKFKKPVLSSMSVLDPRGLDPSVRQKLLDAFAALRDNELGPLPQMGTDPVRKQIDDALSDALSLPDLTVLREMLGREPVVNVSLLVAPGL